MLLPHEYHLFNGDPFCFRQEQVDKNGHNGNPPCKEEEEPELQGTEEREERLSDDESEEEVNGHCYALAC